MRGVADMTYIPTWAGFIYLAVVVDVWSRRIVGWSFGETMTSDLVLAALNMALELRKPADVIHHSDQGSQYTSIAFGKRCKEMGVRPSMGTVGDAYDNAMAESVFASLECELIDRRSFKTKTEARLAVFTWIEAWYKPAPASLGAWPNLAHQLRKDARRQAQNTTAGRTTRVAHRRPVRGWRHADRGQPCTDAHRDLRIKPSTVRESGATPILTRSAD